MADVKVAIGIWWPIMQNERRRPFPILGLPGIEVIGTFLQIYRAVLRYRSKAVFRLANASAPPGVGGRPMTVTYGNEDLGNLNVDDHDLGGCTGISGRHSWRFLKP